ncbi:hypothetical protein Hanom_Chr00s000002g01598931 [Helianthus anomalus]
MSAATKKGGGQPPILEEGERDRVGGGYQPAVCWFGQEIERKGVGVRVYQYVYGWQKSSSESRADRQPASCSGRRSNKRGDRVFVYVTYEI